MKKGPGKIQTISTDLHYPHLTGRQPQVTNQRGIILRTPLRNQEALYSPARKDVNKSSSTDLTETERNMASADCGKIEAGFRCTKKLPEASPHALHPNAPCGNRQRTLRQVLEYLPQSTIAYPAKRLPSIPPVPISLRVDRHTLTDTPRRHTVKMLEAMPSSGFGHSPARSLTNYKTLRRQKEV